MPFKMVDSTLKDIQSGQNVILHCHGTLGSGKTTFLKAIKSDVKRSAGQMLSFYVDLAKNVLNPKLAIIYALADYLSPEFNSESRLPEQLRPFQSILLKAGINTPEREPYEFLLADEKQCFRQLCKTLKDNHEDAGLIILLDNLKNCSTIDDIFPNDLDGIGVIVASESALQSKYCARATQRSVELPSLTTIDIERILIRKNRDISEIRSVAKTIREVSGGIPRNVFSIIEYLIEQTTRTKAETASLIDADLIQKIVSSQNVLTNINTLSPNAKRLLYLSSLFDGYFSYSNLQVVYGDNSSLSFALDELKACKLISDSIENGFSLNVQPELIIPERQASRDALLRALSNILENFKETSNIDKQLSRILVENYNHLDNLDKTDEIHLLNHLACTFYESRSTSYLEEVVCRYIDITPLRTTNEQIREMVICTINNIANHSILIRKSHICQALIRIADSYQEHVEDRVIVYDSYIQSLKLNREYDKSLKAASAYVKQLGYNISTDFIFFTFLYDFVRLVLIHLWRSRAGYIYTALTDPKILASARIVRTISGSAYMNSDSKLQPPKIIMLGMRWTLKNGVGPGSTYAFYGFELLKATIKEHAYLILKRLPSIRLTKPKVSRYSGIEEQSFDDPFFQSRTIFIKSAFSDPLKGNFINGINRLSDSYLYSLDSGDHEFAGYSSSVKAWFQIVYGLSLDTIEKDIQTRFKTLENIADAALTYNHKTILKLIHSVQTTTPPVFSPPPNNPLNSEYLDSLSSSIYFFVADDIKNGLSATSLALKQYWGAVGLPLLPFTYLLYIYFYKEANPKASSYRLYMLENKIRYWAETNPDDFYHYYILCRALCEKRLSKRLKLINQADRHIPPDAPFFRFFTCREKAKIYSAFGDNEASKSMDLKTSQHLSNWKHAPSGSCKNEEHRSDNKELAYIISYQNKLIDSRNILESAKALLEATSNIIQSNIHGFFFLSENLCEGFLYDPSGKDLKHHTLDHSHLKEFLSDIYPEDVRIITTHTDNQKALLVTDKGKNLDTDYPTLKVLLNFYTLRINSMIFNDATSFIPKIADRITDAVCILTQRSNDQFFQARYNNPAHRILNTEKVTNSRTISSAIKAITDGFEDQAPYIRREIKRTNHIDAREFQLALENGEKTRVTFTYLRSYSEQNELTSHAFIFCEKWNDSTLTFSDIFRRLTHEIRTPASSIAGYLQIAEEKYRKGQSIHSELDTLSKIVQIMLGTLDLSVVAINTQSNTSSTNAAINIKDLIQTLLLLSRTPSKNIEYEQIIEIPENLNTNAARDIDAILRNLVVNAFKYTESGKICVKIEGTEENGSLLVHGEVTDTGIGIPPKKLGTIFNQGTVVEEKNKRYWHSTGYGLSYVSESIERLEGHIEVESTLDVGTRFLFSFKVPVIQSVHKNNIQFDLKALIVEDNENLSTIMKHILTKLDVQFSSVSNGFDAVKNYKKDLSFDIVLMDINLPGMDGYETTRRIKEMDPEALVIAVTAADDNTVEMKSKLAGITEILTKPIKKDSLSAVLIRYFDPIYLEENETALYKGSDEAFIINQNISIYKQFIARVWKGENLYELTHDLLSALRETGLKEDLNFVEEARNMPNLDTHKNRIIEIVEANISRLTQNLEHRVKS